MKRLLPLTAISIAGLAIGWFGAAATSRPPDRAAQAIALFQSYCLPMINRDHPKPDQSLERLTLWPEQNDWFDAKSGWVVTLDDTTCRLSDMLVRLQTADLERLKGMLAQVIEADLPMLQRDTKLEAESGWETFIIWIEHPALDPRRWGVTLSRFSADEPVLLTLTTGRPQAPKP